MRTHEEAIEWTKQMMYDEAFLNISRYRGQIHYLRTDKEGRMHFLVTHPLEEDRYFRVDNMCDTEIYQNGEWKYVVTI
ncbi:hypothetical protein COK07_29325 [Bacillus thuringiensis]|uniref:hypothetical protein n=1 Tax=Bacillus thuringiensis TaxID=1428 RepID=UPI000BF6352E|nr:hypothetical protein [Bacillus thuringiensis]PFI26737.1 hypothetical protein COI53_27065 [Bacillus thuringiensis]PFP70054.1 hypothetical protein COK07_29325 [Bacillus thuringiensis]